MTGSEMPEPSHAVALEFCVLAYYQLVEALDKYFFDEK